MYRRSFLKKSLLTTSLALPLIPSFDVKPKEKGSFLINSGVGGNNTDDLLERIGTDCLIHQPDLTILMVGTNDMNSRKYIPLAQYEKNLVDIVSKIKAVKSQLLITTILPCYELYLYTRHPKEFYGSEGHSGRKLKINNTIKKVAKAHNVPLLDLHHIFEKVGNVGLEASSLIQNEANSNKTDGIHPTPEGYRVMAVAIYDFIVQNKLPQKRIVCFGDSITAGDGGTEGKSYPAYLKKLLEVY